jgi:hypothetical protein
LKPATAWNFDLGIPVFSNSIGLFTTNVFYKEITNLIYSMQNYQPFLNRDVINAPADIFDRLPTTSYYDTTWAKNNSGKSATTNIPMNNPNRTFIKGIEFSWQTHLWYLPGILGGIVLDLNLSFINSSTHYPYFEQVKVGGTALKPIYKLDYRTRKGELQDQPKAIYNAIVGWDYRGFSSRVSFRYQERTLTSLDTKYSLRDAYYDNVLLVDVALKQKLMNQLSLFANLTNINKHIDEYYLIAPEYKLPTSQQTYGFRGQFGIGFNY